MGNRVDIDRIVRVDPARLNAAVERLREQHAGQDPVANLKNALLGYNEFGRLPHAATAQKKLSDALDFVLGEMRKHHIDMRDLESRTQAAALIAEGVDPDTIGVARRAREYEP